MKIFDKYGLEVESLLKAKEIFEEISEISLESRSSSYKGLYYSNSIPGESEKYEIRSNYFEGEGWNEEKYTEYNAILYISCSLRSDELREQLLNQNKVKIIFINRTVITENRWDMEYNYINGKDILISKKKLPPSL